MIAPDFDDVMALARRWYYSEIRSIVDDAIARLSKQEPALLHDKYEAREWLERDIDETTDGHEFVIYTGKAAMVCAASDCDGAYEDMTSDKPPSVEAQACLAMRADIWQLLDARADEWQKEPPTTEEV